MKYKTVIFDLDGTLLYTLADLADSTNMTMEHFGYPHRTYDDVRQFVGNGVTELIRRAVPETLSEERFEEIVAYQREVYSQHHLDKTVPYDGVMDLLKSLKARGVTTAVVSNKAQGSVTSLSEHFFGDLISVSVGEAPGIRKKPAPDTVNMAMEQLGAGHYDSVYIGDSEVDVATARNAGIDCIAVDWGFRSREELKEAGAGIICSTPEEVLYVMEDNRFLHADIERYIYTNMAPPASSRSAGSSRLLRMETVDDTVVESNRIESLMDFDAVSFKPAAKARKLDDVVKELEQGFSESLLRLIDDKHYTDPEVYKRAGVDRKLFSKIRSDSDYQPSKDTAVALCIGLKLSMDETVDLLSKAGYAFSASNRRDMIIRYFIENGEYNLFRINEALDYFHEKCL